MHTAHLLGAILGTYFKDGHTFVRLYNGDHNPPHVHIWTPDGELLVSLVTLEPVTGDIGRQEFDVAMKWIRSNIHFLRAEWDRLNG
jgi:hypothetical protein